MLDVLGSGIRNFQGLIRSVKLTGVPLIFSDMVHEAEQTDDPEVMCTPLFKRRNFEAPNTLTDHLSAAPIAVPNRSSAFVRLNASECTDSRDSTCSFRLFCGTLKRLL